VLQLTAKFIIQLSNGSILVCRDVTEELRYRARIEDFDVEICLNPDFKVWRNLHGHSKPETNEDHYFGLSRILILVTGQEESEPPPVSVVNGITNYEERQRYFEERKPAYRAIAWTALDRTIRYFKYRLHNPLLSTPSQYSKNLQNPSWTDNTGQEFKLAGSTLVGHCLPQLASFGVRCLSANEGLNLEQALERPVEPELHEELMADAQTAIFEGNLRRGALEMAIACEVAVKQVFFAKSSIAGEAYEYLESKRKVAVSVPELIDGAAKQAFGESFKTMHSLAFESISYLFECRNKIAHRGEAWYRDHNKKGTRHELDRDTLATWWKAVEELLNWLAGQTHR
jgi:hypothetical protein